jgi:hypothetical protein
MADGHVDMHFTLYDNTDRVVRFNSKTKRPEDSHYQAEKSRILPQTHY